MNATRRRRTHRFDHDTTVPADVHDRRWCRCGLPEHHPAHHDPPEPPPDRSSKILGERDDD